MKEVVVETTWSNTVYT